MFWKTLILLGSMWIHTGVDGQYSPMQPIQVKISPWQNRQALIFTPEKPARGQKYPLLICFHGRSIAGHDLGRILRQGVARQIHEGKKIAAVNPVDKKLYEFIVVAPLAESWSFAPQDVEPMLDDLIKRYPMIDTSRIYLTGYSAGGWSVESAKTHNKRLAQRIAACITMSPPIIDSPYLRRYKLPSDENIHTWYFAGAQDGYFLKSARTFVDSTSRYKQGLTKLTVYDGGHCCWESYYSPEYRENGMNIYEWLLQYKNSD
jgi:predicted peptidase